MENSIKKYFDFFFIETFPKTNKKISIHGSDNYLNKFDNYYYTKVAYTFAYVFYYSHGPNKVGHGQNSTFNQVMRVRTSNEPISVEQILCLGGYVIVFRM